MKLDLLFLECNEVASSEFSGVYGLCVTSGYLYFNVQGCWRISLVCLALKLVGSWLDLYFSIGMEAFG